jgi:hypothetical protein
MRQAGSKPTYRVPPSKISITTLTVSEAQFTLSDRDILQELFDIEQHSLVEGGDLTDLFESYMNQLEADNLKAGGANPHLPPRFSSASEPFMTSAAGEDFLM